MSNFNDTEFPHRFPKNTQISNFIKIRPVLAELFHAGGQTDMTKLTDVFAVLRKATKCVASNERHGEFAGG